MKAAGATQYTFHVEAASDVKRCIRRIREADMKVSVLVYSIVQLIQFLIGIKWSLYAYMLMLDRLN